MATIPSGTKFLGVDPAFTDLTEKKGSKVDRKSEYFTLDDITATIGAGSQGPEGPEGPAGPPGPVGPAGLEWQGAWDTDSSYAEDDAVGFNGASWFCISAVTGTGNSNPEEDTTHWALLAAQGAQGIQGIQGPIGPQGPSGGSGTLQQAFDNGRTMTTYNFTAGVFNAAPGISVKNTSTLDETTLETTKLTFTKNSFGLKTTNVLQAITPTANRTIRFPDLDGTIALQNYKIYRALLNQTGSSAPIATVLENGFTGAIVWTRNSDGNFTGTLSGQFPSNKTFITNGFVELNFLGDKVYVYRDTNNAIGVISTINGGGADGLLTNFPIEIIVYN